MLTLEIFYLLDFFGLGCFSIIILSVLQILLRDSRILKRNQIFFQEIRLRHYNNIFYDSKREI